MSAVCWHSASGQSGANHVAPTLVGYPYDL